MRLAVDRAAAVCVVCGAWVADAAGNETALSHSSALPDDTMAALFQALPR